MDDRQAFRVAGRQLISDVIEGEAVLIDLASGTYYSLEGAGAEIWQMLGEGLSPTEIGASLERRYVAEPGRICSAVSALLGELLEEGLIEPAAAGQRSAGSTRVESGERADFVTPVLRRYSDMQDLLLLDPIHDTDEVDELGWPRGGEPPNDPAG